MADAARISREIRIDKLLYGGKLSLCFVYLPSFVFFVFSTGVTAVSLC